MPILISQVSLITVKMNKEAPIGADFYLTFNISHYHRMKSAPNGASLFILTVLLRDIVRSRSAPIGADFDNDSISHYS